MTTEVKIERLTQLLQARGLLPYNSFGLKETILSDLAGRAAEFCADKLILIAKSKVYAGKYDVFSTYKAKHSGYADSYHEALILAMEEN